MLTSIAIIVIDLTSVLVGLMTGRYEERDRICYWLRSNDHRRDDDLAADIKFGEHR